MKRKYKTIKDDAWSLTNNRTGEVREHHVHLRAKTFTDFFIACFAAWNDFKMSEGTMVKVFIHCIMASSPSSLHGVEGNYFYVSDVYESIKRNNEFVGCSVDMKDVNVRQYIKKLADGGFISKAERKDEKTGRKVGIRGKYLINPKYGIKGVITEDTYSLLTVERVPSRRIRQNDNFEKEGGAE